MLIFFPGSFRLLAINISQESERTQRLTQVSTKRKRRGGGGKSNQYQYQYFQGQTPLESPSRTIWDTAPFSLSAPQKI